VATDYQTAVETLVRDYVHRFGEVDAFASTRQEGEEWQTRGRWFSRQGGKTVRIKAPSSQGGQKQPAAQKPAPAKPADRAGQFASAWGSLVSRVHGSQGQAGVERSRAELGAALEGMKPAELAAAMRQIGYTPERSHAANVRRMKSNLDMHLQDAMTREEVIAATRGTPPAAPARPAPKPAQPTPLDPSNPEMQARAAAAKARGWSGGGIPPPAPWSALPKPQAAAPPKPAPPAAPQKPAGERPDFEFPDVADDGVDPVGAALSVAASAGVGVARGVYRKARRLVTGSNGTGTPPDSAPPPPPAAAKHLEQAKAADTQKYGGPAASILHRVGVTLLRFFLKGVGAAGGAAIGAAAGFGLTGGNPLGAIGGGLAGGVLGGNSLTLPANLTGPRVRALARKTARAVVPPAVGAAVGVPAVAAAGVGLPAVGGAVGGPPGAVAGTVAGVKAGMNAARNAADLANATRRRMATSAVSRRKAARYGNPFSEFAEGLPTNAVALLKARLRVAARKAGVTLPPVPDEVVVKALELAAQDAQAQAMGECVRMAGKAARSLERLARA
jgi:hypothetical protein